MNRFRWISGLIVFLIIMRFALGFVVMLVVRFWYVFLILAAIHLLFYRKKPRPVKPDELDPDKEIKVYPPPTIEDE
ncbi:MAG: hypothetical protein J7K89_01350 [Candidatus Cloacimonetes bacterium]|nr:hypothetical protein [Candidatus Cloacimonadota bacterium]